MVLLHELLLTLEWQPWARPGLSTGVYRDPQCTEQGSSIPAKPTIRPEWRFHAHAFFRALIATRVLSVRAINTPHSTHSLPPNLQSSRERLPKMGRPASAARKPYAATATRTSSRSMERPMYQREKSRVTGKA
jgi:hypothetical protein